MSAKGNEVTLNKDSDGVHWKVIFLIALYIKEIKNILLKKKQMAILQPQLLKDTVRRFSVFIKKMKVPGELYIGYK